MADEKKAGSGTVEVSLRRDLGLLEVLMIGIGPNIGSSIFILIGFAVGIAGPAIIVAFVLNFFVTLLTAVSYAELSSAFPETGGGYRWIKEGLFPPFGFLGGWMSWVGHCIACAVYALGFGWGVSALLSQYNVPLFGLSPDDIAKLFAALIAAFFIYLNYRGVKGAGRSEIIVSFFLIGIIAIYILFCALAIFSGGTVSNAFEPFFPPMAIMSIATSMGFTFMIFEGYEVVAQTGEEAKNPEKTIPRAMFLCIIISAVIFILVAIVTIAVLGWKPISDLTTMGNGQDALVVASQKVVPVLGGALISIGIIVGSIAAVNSIVFSSSRVSFAMGRDGNLPTVFGRLHPKNQTPSAALLISGAIIVSACVLLPLNQVAAAADILILLLFTFVNVAALSLRRKRPDVKRHFVTPFFPYVPLAGIASKLFLAVMLFNYEPLAWYFAFAVIFIGLFIHYFVRGRKEIEKVEIPIRAPLTREELAKYRVLIPIDDPKNMPIIDLGCLLASRHNGELLLTSVIEVPTSVPIDAVDKETIDQRKKMLDKLKTYAELRGVGTRALVSVSHEVVTAVVDTAKEEAANVILVGWKGYTRTKKRILGRKMDALLRQTPCDVIVLKAEERIRPDNILVLSGGLWHVSKATEVAADIAVAEKSRVTILNVVVNEKYLTKAREYSKRLKEIVESAGAPVITKEIRPETIIGGVVAESMDYDLLIIGASAAKRWEKFAFGPIQDKIAQTARCPVLVYKRVVGTEMAPGPIPSAEGLSAERQESGTRQQNEE
jgi:amino acid transporter/nucleotide-binding universal stress UspA family protein